MSAIFWQLPWLVIPNQSGTKQNQRIDRWNEGPIHASPSQCLQSVLRQTSSLSRIWHMFSPLGHTYSLLGGQYVPNLGVFGNSLLGWTSRFWEFVVPFRDDGAKTNPFIPYLVPCQVPRSAPAQTCTQASCGTTPRTPLTPRTGCEQNPKINSRLYVEGSSISSWITHLNVLILGLSPESKLHVQSDFFWSVQQHQPSKSRIVPRGWIIQGVDPSFWNTPGAACLKIPSRWRQTLRNQASAIVQFLIILAASDLSDQLQCLIETDHLSWLPENFLEYWTRRRQCHWDRHISAKEISVEASFESTTGWLPLEWHTP